MQIEMLAQAKVRQSDLTDVDSAGRGDVNASDDLFPRMEEVITGPIATGGRPCARCFERLIGGIKRCSTDGQGYRDSPAKEHDALYRDSIHDTVF